MLNTPEELELLAYMLEEEGIAVAPRQTIVPRTRQIDLPLSFAQERLWLIDRWEPGNAAYNIPFALRLTGRLNAAALQHTLHEVVRRHEVLRTTFPAIDGRPTQVIGPPLRLPLQIVDLRHLPQEARETAVRRMAHEEARGPFDLQRGPLIRAALVHLADDEHVFLLNMHHIISDGWSTGVLFREMLALYAAFDQGRPSPLPELPIQYADFALWQRQWLQGEVLEQQLGYWRRQLADLPVLELPTDHPRPPVQSYRGAHQPVQISRLTSAALEALSKRYGATLFMTLLAAFQTLLYRYSGQEDIVVGSPIANRDLVEVEPSIGLFVNTLILRADLRRNPRFCDLLAQVREITLEAYAHQNVPFEQLVKVLRPQRDPGRPPLFQVMFVLQNAPQPSAELPDLTIIPLTVDNPASKFDLMLGLTATPEGLRGSLEYSTDLFDPATIARFVTHFQALLASIAPDPEQRIANLPLLPVTEEHLLKAWNPAQAERGERVFMHQLFELQAERTPDAAALEFKDTLLTYGELNRRANQLAHHLRTLGVGPEERVGLCLERSVELVIGLLGILKAGGAYVPLDPLYPHERLQWMLADAGAHFVVTRQPRVFALSENDIRIVCLDRDWPEIAQAPVTNPHSRTAGDDLAYVIYTSGSTGQPKGVMVPHHALVGYTCAARKLYALAPTDRMLQFASISFDTSVEEICTSLTAGATLVLRTEEMLDTPAIFLRTCERWNLTVLSLPTAYWHNLVASLVADRLTLPQALRLVIIGGERAAPERVAQWRTHVGNQAQLMNTYGPTEATVVATAYTVPATGSLDRPEVPIGRPLPPLRTYILDPLGQMAPIGVPGELYLGGDSLARGYLNRPDLTAAGFIPDPFSQEPGARMYRTGDRVRYLSDGNIEFVDRVDQQVKIRGFRVEPGEVEAALGKHPAVRAAVVLAREDTPGDPRLIAYVVPDEGQTPSIRDLRDYLKATLPDYMVPAAIVLLETLPLTSGGKVDRRALPASDGARPTQEDAFVAPRTPIEADLAAIWSSMLNVAQVAVYDDFFELGGHSLLATQILSRIHAVLRVDLPLRNLFETPTIAALAERIEQIRSATQDMPAAIQPVARDAPLPLSFAQQRLWFLDQIEPGSAAYNIPTCVRLHGMLDLTALERALDMLVARHEVLRTTFATVGGEPRQIITPVRLRALPVVDLQGLPQPEREERAQHLAQQEAGRPFDLQQGPLLRASVLRLASDDHVLLLVLHHIVSDAWSQDVLFRELTTLYTALVVGQHAILPDLPIQYADFTIWQRQRLQGPLLEQQLAYWRQQLEGAPAVLELPSDRPLPPVPSYRSAHLSFEVPLSVASALRTLSQRSGVTLFMTLLAAFQTLLHRYSDQDDIVVGSPIAGRTHGELENLIGFFVNTLVLRGDLRGNPSFSELLDRVHEVCLGAYTHQDLPFEKLVEELQPARDLSHTPLFQVMFVFQNAPRAPIHMPGLSLRVVEWDHPTAKFDLTLWLTETVHGLRGGLEYNTDLFEAASMGRLVAHFQTLLAGIIADPDRRIADLPLLSPAEQQQLAAWNHTSAVYPRTLCIHQLFEAQAVRTPDAIAVVFGEQYLTYADLNCRANQLAHHLQALGVGPEVLVGLCLERSLDLIVGLLGILKAGGAYLPLDPAYPPERLHRMLTDAQPPVLLTQTQLLERLPEHHAQRLCLDATWPRLAQESTGNPYTTVRPDNLAYVIYTSGSTGSPKGVLVAHRGLCNLVTAQAEAFGISLQSRVLQGASVSFDASVSEIFMALTRGAVLCLAGSDTLRSPIDLLQFLRSEGITTITLGPALLSLLPDAALPSLQTVISAGEACSWELAARWAPGRRFFNAYGPTEATVGPTLYRVEHGADGAGSVPIGQPIANSHVYLLDRYLQPVPVGIPGEVYIGGVGLARGYLNRPDLTAEQFLPDPFSLEPGMRMYHTGDRARYLPDGNIEFLGRVDQQVKIRGFRVELGEIEALLLQHPAIREAAVIMREECPDDKRLVAYIVPDRGQTPNNGELRTWIKAKLPDYMVPAAFVLLEDLPLTPNGKLNRQALPAPNLLYRANGAAPIAPRDTWEWRLVQVWEELLGVHPLGVTDNFFELGGHSLLAVRLMSHIQQQFERTVPLATLFQTPTIEHLAIYLRQPVAPDRWSPLVPLQSGGERLPFFCIHPVGGTVLCYAELARALGSDQPFYGVQARGLEPGQIPYTDIRAMAREYLTAIREMQPQGPYLLGGWSSGSIVAFELARQLREQGRNVALLAIIDSSAPRTSTVTSDEALLLARFADNLGTLIGKELPISANELGALPSGARLDYVLEKARNLAVVPPDVAVEQVQRLARVFQANLNAMQQYRPEVVPQHVTVFQAYEPIAHGHYVNFSRGWRKLAAGGVTTYITPGDHRTMLQVPHVEFIAARLRACLDAAQVSSIEI